MNGPVILACVQWLWVWMPPATPRDFGESLTLQIIKETLEQMLAVGGLSFWNKSVQILWMAMQCFLQLKRTKGTPPEDVSELPLAQVEACLSLLAERRMAQHMLEFLSMDRNLHDGLGLLYFHLDLDPITPLKTFHQLLSRDPQECPVELRVVIWDAIGLLETLKAWKNMKDENNRLAAQPPMMSLPLSPMSSFNQSPASELPVPSEVPSDDGEL